MQDTDLSTLTPDPQAAAGASEIIMVTGPSGAGRSTAINALEDLGHETIDNVPIFLLPRLIEGPALTRPLALGIGVGSRDFSTDSMIAMIDRLSARTDVSLTVLYLDCGEDEILQRFSATRRRHPLFDQGSPMVAIRKERELLMPLRARADVVIRTDGMTPHDLTREMGQWFAPDGERPMTVTLQSFSYKRGLPRGLDFVLDCRFLRNPHWEAALRDKDGRDPVVQDYVMSDPDYPAFRDRVLDLLRLVLPGARREGKAHVSIGFGCTGGQHRSVTLAETLARTLAEEGWPVSKRHRELERRDGGGQRDPNG